MVSLRDLVRAFAGAMNLISPEVEDHHEKVAILSYYLAEEMGLSPESKRMVFFGGLFHDIGGILAGTDLSLLDLEASAGAVTRKGALLLNMFPFTQPFADIVYFSQTIWSDLAASAFDEQKPEHLAQIVHLADVLTLIIYQDTPVLNQLAEAKEILFGCANSEIAPELSAAFKDLCLRESVWMDMLYHPEDFHKLIPTWRRVNMEELTDLTGFISKVIDFRSPFTAMHSAGVAESAVLLAQKAGMSEEECAAMRIAGNLHDVGKLKVPASILEKPGKLTDEEFNIMKEHTYHSYRILSLIENFDDIAAWAAFHHEKLDGKGYPFHIDAAKLPLGSRIMTVADIFSATTEDRPYRKGMSKERVVSILREDAERGKLSKQIVELLVQHYDEINNCREKASREASQKYQELLRQAG